MKAIVAKKYGPPSVLHLVEMAKPVPKDNEVLIKVCASSINSGDHRTLRAKPFFIRFMGAGILRPKQPIPGIDMAGVVQAVGRGVSRFKPGDEVYGDVYTDGSGAFAEYVCLSQDTNITRKPKNMSFAQSAAVPVAGLTALQALRDHGHVKAGDEVLVNGASGGVGTFCVIIAKALGAVVTGVCSTRNVDLVREIGADHVIDYKKQGIAKLDKRYDAVIDIAANITPNDYTRMLKPGGRGVLVGFSSMLGMLQIMRKGKKSKSQAATFGMMGMAQANIKDFDTLREMMEDGQITPVIDKIYPLEKAADAMRYFEEKHARAKVVISMCEGA